MADKPEGTTPQKPPFLTTLPGILTGLGGVLVAMTGLITALYSNGVIGTKANTNANTAVMLSSVPPESATANLENSQFKLLNGAWELIETRPKSMGGAKVTWIFNATVAGNVLRMTGKMTAFNDKLVSTQGKETRAVLELNLVDPTRTGFFETTPKNSPTMRFPAVLVELNSESPITIHSNINLPRNEFCGLMGKKL
ncbi:MAG: hypothetical protein ACKVQJ_05290 [Pyrinomonadaceae bacterium]